MIAQGGPVGGRRSASRATRTGAHPEDSARMKKAILAISLPALAVLAIAVGVVWWDRGAPPGFRPRTVEVRPSELTYDHRGVDVTGTAHYPIQLVQTGGRSGTKYWLFPLFEKGDTMGRHILVLVRSPRQPDELLAFEDRRVRGLARPPGGTVGPEVRKAFTEAGYSLDDRLVLIEEFED